MNNKDGGPAFPHADLDDLDHIRGMKSGMSLRDYFAAHAMQGLCAADPDLALPADKIADLAYEQADAMLKVRAR